MLSYTIVRFIPKRLLSRLTGRLARLRLPKFVIVPFLYIFCRMYGVNRAELDRPLESFRSFLEFFTRNLPSQLRPVGTAPVSPVDGTLRSHGQIRNDSIFEVKGQPYSVDELLGNSNFSSSFRGGTYFNFYLAPGDYHHVHMPISGRVVRVIHVPGDLWPVNDWAFLNVPRLLSRNERVTLILETELGRVALVLIGALNVGSISLEKANITTNRCLLTNQRISEQTLDQVRFEAGQRVGTFKLGSSVILMFEEQVLKSKVFNFAPGAKVKYGQSLVT